MSKTKNQHYVPYFYIKRFATEDKIDIYDIPLGEVRGNQAIEKNACRHLFYDIDYKELKPFLKEIFELRPDIKDKDVFKDNQYVEHYLSRVESAANHIFNELEKDTTLINDYDNRYILTIFLHDLAHRTEGIRKTDETFNKQIYDQLSEAFPAEYLTQFDESAAKKKQLYHLLSIKSLLRTSTVLFEHYNWYIGINQSTQINFIISDNPALNVIIRYNDMCIPFSQKYALILKNKDKNATLITHDTPTKEKIYLSEMSVLKYNIQQISSANKYIFGDKKTLELLTPLIKITPTINSQ